MHEISKPHPLLCLAANLALLALLISLRQESALLPKMVQEVFNNKCAFGNNHRFSGVRVLDAEDGGLAQRMDLFEFRRRKVRLRIPMKDLQLVGKFQFF